MGRTLGVARRLGKHMWWEMHGGGAKTPESLSPLFHFGMTGAMSVKGEGARPSADRLSWTRRAGPTRLGAGRHVRQRRVARVAIHGFGRVRLVAGDVEASPRSPISRFDPLLAMPPDAEFAAMYAARAAPIKAALLDQKIAAGARGWIADEVLYHAGVHPETRAKDLSRAQPRRNSSGDGLCRRGGVPGGRRRGAASRATGCSRWGKVAGKVGGKPISFITVGGRTTAFVAAVQKKGRRQRRESEGAGDEGGGHRGGEKNGAEGGEDGGASAKEGKENAAGGEGHSRSQESGAGETASASEESGAAEESGRPLRRARLG